MISRAEYHIHSPHRTFYCTYTGGMENITWQKFMNGYCWLRKMYKLHFAASHTQFDTQNTVIHRFDNQTKQTYNWKSIIQMYYFIVRII